MNQIFEPKEFFEIPDGTMLSAFLNPKDSTSNLPFNLIDGFSVAYGIIKKHESSKIHVHPYVDQVTYVLSGKITLRMKGKNDNDSYPVELYANHSAISIGGEFFQLINKSNEDTHVLYIVSPAYLFDKRGEEVFYDDSIMLDYSWEELKKMNWKPAELNEKEHSKKAREEAFLRLSQRGEYNLINLH
ncbi:MAG: cupin domain-containing protein [Bacteroidales bacterium]|nr:cupin domain-containing protein [Bacteroidales bacterium]